MQQGLKFIPDIVSRIMEGVSAGDGKMVMEEAISAIHGPENPGKGKAAQDEGKGPDEDLHELRAPMAIDSRAAGKDYTWIGLTRP